MSEHKIREAAEANAFAPIKAELQKVINVFILHCLGPSFQKGCTQCIIARGLCYELLSTKELAKLNEVPNIFQPEFCTLKEVKKLNFPEVKAVSN